jgi:hypothetical protein
LVIIPTAFGEGARQSIHGGDLDATARRPAGRQLDLLIHFSLDRFDVDLDRGFC